VAGAFVLVGEPGNGKTFLVEYLCSIYRHFLSKEGNTKYTFQFTDVNAFYANRQKDVLLTQRVAKSNIQRLFKINLEKTYEHYISQVFIYFVSVGYESNTTFTRQPAITRLIVFIFLGRFIQ
jgi:Cdc6-like AAA superfamily ATPase